MLFVSLGFKKRVLCCLYFFIASFLILNVKNASGQSITLNSNSYTVNEADDYFKDVQQHPRDFNNYCDLGFDNYRYSTKTINDGIWSGTHNGGTGPIINFVTIPTTGTNLAVSREDCREMGMHEGYRIDASKYRNISYKVKNTKNTSVAVLWSKNYDYSIHGFDDFDGYYLPGVGVNNTANEWVVKSYNIPAKASPSFPWSGEIRGLSIWPSFSQPINGTTSLDWVRLYDPDTSTKIPFSWSTTNASASNYYVNIYVDNNNSGYDGYVIQRQLAKNGSTDFDTGQLPQGKYYFYLTLERYTNSTATTVARSNYSAELTVNSKPLLNFTSPTRLTGKEYSRDEVGDPWDMNNQEDVINLVDANGNPTPAGYRGLHNWRFENGFFKATSDYDPVGFT
nr:hypothetical protein [Pseudomonadota bacterium]